MSINCCISYLFLKIELGAMMHHRSNHHPHRVWPANLPHYLASYYHRIKCEAAKLIPGFSSQYTLEWRHALLVLGPEWPDARYQSPTQAHRLQRPAAAGCDYQ